MTFSNHGSFGGILTVQAEHMARHGFSVASGSKADGKKFVKATAHEATLSTELSGKPGIYTLAIHAQDECDGQSVIQIVVNGVVVGEVKLDRDNNGVGSDNGHFQSFSAPGIEIPENAKIELRAVRDGGEWVRIDKITLEKTADLPNPPVAEPQHSFVIEAEDMDADGYHVVSGKHASEGKLVQTTAHTASLSTDFSGASGVYTVTIVAQDECDGRSTIEVWVGGAKVGEVKLDRDNNGGGSNNGKFNDYVLTGLEIPEGAEFELVLKRDGDERGRIDAVKFDKTADLPADGGGGDDAGGDAPGAASCTFTLSKGGVDLEVTLTEQTDGSMKIDVEVLGSGKFIGDIQGLFFDLDDSGKLHGMTVAGDDVTGSQFRDGKVVNLGQGANMNGAGKFDGGVRIGTAGIGKDDIQSTSFILSSDHDDPLTLDDFRGQDFGVRLTSVGKEGGSRDDSLKVTGNAGDLPCDDHAGPPVGPDPEPDPQPQPDPQPPVVDGDSCAFIVKKCGINLKVTLTEQDDGTMKIRVEVLDSGKFIGDLQGLFFEIANEDKLVHMEVTGADITGSQFKADKVVNLGAGVNVHGLGNKFDGGVKFGTPGIGKDDIRDTTFVLSSPDGLTLEDFRNQDFAFRLTSVGKENGSREDSVKIGGNAGELDCVKPPVEVASLGNFVWFDDGDGVQQADELGVEGVTVTLFTAGADGVFGTADDVEAATTTTDAAGFYEFTGLTPGQPYQVAFSDIPEDYDFTLPNVGNDALDSDANQNTGRTGTVVLAPGEFNDTIDAGLVIKAPCAEDGVRLTFSELSAGDDVFGSYLFELGLVITAEKPNGEAAVPMIFDTYDPTGGDFDLATFGQGNVLIISEDGDAEDPDDNWNGGTITFTFINGTAIIGDLTVIDIEEVGGTIVLYDIDGAEIKTLQIPANGDGSIADIVVNEAGVAVMEVNFVGSGAIDDICITPVEGPNATTAILGDYVWFDENRDGVQDDDEVGVNGVTVRLLDGSGFQLDQATTIDNPENGEAGWYLFDNLDPNAEYVVEFVAPDGFTFTTPLQGGDTALDSNADEVTGRSGTVVIGEVPGENLTIDAGLVTALGAITGTLFCDKNGNGLRDETDPGVGPRTVVLFDAGGDEITRTQTAADGSYSFGGLEAGAYSVQFLVQGLTTQDFGDDDTIDSDVDANGLSGPVTVGAGEVVENLDAGVLCFQTNDTGILGIGAAIDRSGGQALLQVLNDQLVGTIYDADTDVLIVNTNVGGQLFLAPTLPTPVRMEVVVGVDAAGQLTGSGSGPEFFIWNDANNDGQRSVGEEIYVEGDVIAFGSSNAFPNASFLMDFGVLTTGGTRQDVFPDLVGFQINAEFANASQGFGADFATDNVKGSLLGNLAYDCLC